MGRWQQKINPTWKRMVRRARGAVHVLLKAPAMPPASNCEAVLICEGTRTATAFLVRAAASCTDSEGLASLLLLLLLPGLSSTAPASALCAPPTTPPICVSPACGCIPPNVLVSYRASLLELLIDDFTYENLTTIKICMCTSGSVCWLMILSSCERGKSLATCFPNISALTFFSNLYSFIQHLFQCPREFQVTLINSIKNQSSVWKKYDPCSNSCDLGWIESSA